MADYSDSGKRCRAVVACTDLDVRSVVDPIRFYEADQVILLTDNDDNDPLFPIRQKILEEIRSELEDYTIMTYPTGIRDCYGMMGELWRLFSPDRIDCMSDIYVNLSSGTVEFAIAAMSVCRKTERAVAFTVMTKEYALTSEDISKILFREDRSPGYSLKVSVPAMVMMMDLDRDRTELAECLRMMSEMRIDERNVSFSDIIARMKSCGRWDYTPDRRRGKTDDAQKERMFFKRNFLNPMMELGWIKEDRVMKNRFRLTPQGRMILEIYYGD